MFLGEWLNGRVAVSKTVGCVFESRLPCQYSKNACFWLFLVENGRFLYCSLLYYTPVYYVLLPKNVTKFS